MPLGSILTGQPFKTALRVLIVFLLCYSIAGYLLVSAVKDTLQSELAAKAKAESVLLQEIYQSDGKVGLLAALEKMRQSVQPPDRMVGLFDEGGLKLTGPISSAPEFVGVAHRDVTTMTAGARAGRYALHVRKFENLTLVIGRSADVVEVAGRRLTVGLLYFGGLLSLVTIVLGFWASRASLQRLREMERALFLVSEGDMQARLPVLPRNDQFDRVSVGMNQNLDRLERLVTGAKSTASAIAHDLKTPLTRTQIALNEASEAAEAGRDPTPDLETAIAELQSLNTVFDTMLRISRIQASTEKSRFGRVDLRDIAAKVIEFMQPLAEERIQTLRLDAEEVTVIADAAMLQQALVNLVNNACVHAGQGATVTVAVAENIRGAVLSVTDNGPGIPASDHDKVLEPFVRLDHARTTPGSGLGLALVKAVADHHDATLELSDAGPGLRVDLHLPKIKKV